MLYAISRNSFFFFSKTCILERGFILLLQFRVKRSTYTCVRRTSLGEKSRLKSVRLSFEVSHVNVMLQFFLTPSNRSFHFLNLERPISRFIFIPGNGKFREWRFHSREFPGNTILVVQSLEYETEKAVLFWDFLWHKNYVCMNCETNLASKFAPKPPWPTGFEKSKIHQPNPE